MRGGASGCAGQASKLVSSAYCSGQGFLLCHRTQGESHGAQSPSKKTVFHHSHVFIQQGTCA